MQEWLIHINHLELLAVNYALRAFLPKVQGHKVLVQTDNTTVCQYINKYGGDQVAQSDTVAR